MQTNTEDLELTVPSVGHPHPLDCHSLPFGYFLFSNFTIFFFPQLVGMSLTRVIREKKKNAN